MSRTMRAMVRKIEKKKQDGTENLTLTSQKVKHDPRYSIIKNTVKAKINCNLLIPDFLNDQLYLVAEF